MSAYGHPPRATAWRPGEAGARAGLGAQDSGGSGALAAAARQLGMSEQDIFDLALARSAWRSMVAVRLGAGNARLSWSKTPLPVLLNVTELAHASAFAGVDRGRILLDDSEPTALERADGNWGPAARRLGATGGGAGATVTSLAAEVDRHLSMASDVASQRRRCGPGSGSVRRAR